MSRFVIKDVIFRHLKQWSTPCGSLHLDQKLSENVAENMSGFIINMLDVLRVWFSDLESKGALHTCEAVLIVFLHSWPQGEVEGGWLHVSTYPMTQWAGDWVLSWPKIIGNPNPRFPCYVQTKQTSIYRSVTQLVFASSVLWTEKIHRTELNQTVVRSIFQLWLPKFGVIPVAGCLISKIIQNHSKTGWNWLQVVKQSCALCSLVTTFITFNLIFGSSKTVNN